LILLIIFGYRKARLIAEINFNTNRHPPPATVRPENTAWASTDQRKPRGFLNRAETRTAGTSRHEA
jgi:hypothetical protein